MKKLSIKIVRRFPSDYCHPQHRKLVEYHTWYNTKFDPIPTKKNNPNNIQNVCQFAICITFTYHRVLEVTVPCSSFPVTPSFLASILLMVPLQGQRHRSDRVPASLPPLDGTEAWLAGGGGNPVAIGATTAVAAPVGIRASPAEDCSAPPYVADATRIWWEHFCANSLVFSVRFCSVSLLGQNMTRFRFVTFQQPSFHSLWWCIFRPKWRRFLFCTQTASIFDIWVTVYFQIKSGLVDIVRRTTNIESTFRVFCG